MSAVLEALPDRAYDSRAFALWQEMLTESGGRRVVDFGRLRPGTLAYFFESSFNLDVVAFDLQAVSAARDDECGEPTPERAIKELENQLPQVDKAGSINGALCWDIPNFLSKPELSRLGDWLAHYCASGAPLFVALVTREQMPRLPAGYQVLDSDRLALETPTGEVAAPMYSHNDLKRVWPDFDVVRSFLLQDGRQEYVLRRY